MLALGLSNIGRALLVPRYAATLPDLPMTVSWRYLAISGAFWGAVLITCAIGLLCFRPWSRWFTLVTTTVYQIHVWVDHVLFDASDYAHQRWAWDLMLTLLLLGLVWVSLSLPRARWALSRRVPHTVLGGLAAPPPARPAKTHSNRTDTS
jgi:hypothetical protein